MKNLKLDANSPKDRKDIFVMICDALQLDAEKEAEAFNINSTKSGFNVNVDALFNFFYKKKLKGGFDFGENTISVSFQVKPPKAIDPITEPEKIEETEVDEIDESGFTPLDKELMDKGDDEIEDLF